MKQYVISGGAGFLGSHVTKRLLGQGHKVTVFDSLVTGSLHNLDEVKDHPNLLFSKHDIRTSVHVEGLVDYVCNLASPASPISYFQIPIQTLETNSVGTKHMLELAKEKGARFFHTSTSEVYGDPHIHPQPESYFGNVNPYCLRSCYDEAKRYAEALIFAYRHTYNLNTGMIRIFNTYGPYMQPDDGRVVSTFIRQALKNEDITVQGTGLQTRSFCYVDDQIDGMMKMIHSDEEGPINIGNPHEFSVTDLAHLVIKLTGSHSKLVSIPAALSDPKQRRPDISRAKQKLGWEPKIELEEGLQKTIYWFRQIGY